MKKTTLMGNGGTFSVLLPDKLIDSFDPDNSPPPYKLAKIYYAPIEIAVWRIYASIHWSNKKILQDKPSELLLYYLNAVYKRRKELLESKKFQPETTYIIVKIIEATEKDYILMKFLNEDEDILFTLDGYISKDSLNNDIIEDFITAVINASIEDGKGDDIEDKFFSPAEEEESSYSVGDKDEKNTNIVPVPTPPADTVSNVITSKITEAEDSSIHATSAVTQSATTLAVYEGLIPPTIIENDEEYKALHTQISKLEKEGESLSPPKIGYLLRVTMLMKEYEAARLTKKARVVRMSGRIFSFTAMTREEKAALVEETRKWLISTHGVHIMQFLEIGTRGQPFNAYSFYLQVKLETRLSNNELMELFAKQNLFPILAFM